MTSPKARERVLDAARQLFDENGYSGTSLQMIADRLGVTKAAVYHQFAKKSDIGVALVRPVLDGLRAVLEHTRRVPADDRPAALLDGLVDLFLAQRQVFANIHHDPDLARLIEAEPDWRPLTRLLGLGLLGNAEGLEAHVSIVVLVQGLAAAVQDEQLSAHPDDRLKPALVAVARRLLG